MTLAATLRPALSPVVVALILAVCSPPARAQVTPPPAEPVAPTPAPPPPAPPPTAVAPVRKAPPRVVPRPAPARKPPAPAPVAVTAPPGVRLVPGQPIPPAELEAFVDGAVREAMAAGHVAGVAVSVVQDGQVVLQKGYGLARTRPEAAVDPDTTLFRLGSISKTFTWISVLKAVEAGKINLDQPVNAYLPPRLRIPDENYPDPVRVRQLMDHSAGFEDRELGRLFVDKARNLASLDEALTERRPHRVRKPGDVSAYSNYGAALAGAAAAQVTGKPFDEMIETEVLRPMSLGDTTFRQPYPPTGGLPDPMADAVAGRLSQSFLWTQAGRRLLPTELAGLTPAIAASSTAQDMGRYMLILLADGRTELGEAYGPATARRLRATLSRPAPGLDGWAHGFMEYSLPGGVRGFGHDGATLGFRTSLVVAPALNLGVFVAGNTDTAEGLTWRLPGAVVQRFYAAYRLPPASDPEALRRTAAGDTGLYLPARRAYHGLEGLVDRLTSVTRVSVGEDGRLVVAQGRRARLFTPEGPAGTFRALYGEDRIAFAPAAGRAKLLFLPGGMGAAERLDGLGRPELLAATTILAVVASLLVLFGGLIRGEGRESRAQTRAGQVEAVCAGAWLAAVTVFGVWIWSAGDAGAMMYDWPSPILVASSTLALLAAALTLILVVLLRGVWLDERRVIGWSGARKLRHTATVLVYLTFALVLGAWGGLAPWSS